MKSTTRILSILSCFAALMVFSSGVYADPIGPDTSGQVSTTIYGDARDSNPGDLAVDVVIDWEIDSDGILTATWTVAISDDLIGVGGDYEGENLRIKAFGFNLGYEGEVALSGFDPSDYSFLTDHSVEGTGGTEVEFLICDVNGGGNNCGGGSSVTSSFSFDMELNCVEQDVFLCGDLFSGADIFSGDYIPGDGDGQMAGHIIGFEGGCSGAVGGTYGENVGADGVGDGRGECGSISVPEPGTMSLLGIGLLGFALSRRRRKTA
jgi:hypothetical protein